jgi:uncharacterized membrane protein
MTLMEYLISSIHLISAIMAMLVSAVVLIIPKGTPIHKRIGYVFAVALLTVNISAAFMYNLTGSLNFLHAFILISLLSLFYGMGAAMRRKSKNWLDKHIKGMNGAALGLWAAGFAELTVRVLPGFMNAQQIIYTAIGIGVLFFFVIGFLNYYFLKKHKNYNT